MFFFEKKNQKTFETLAPNFPPVRGLNPEMHKGRLQAGGIEAKKSSFGYLL